MLEVTRASLADKPIIESLMDLYIYDLSKIIPDKNLFHFDSNGHFEYPKLESFFQETEKAVYLFREKGKPIGFCLIHSNPFFNKDQGSKVIGEFFIKDSERLRELGTIAASHVMRLYPGYWEMRVVNENKAAVYFWEKVMRKVAKDNYIIHEKNDFEWLGKVFVGNVK